MLRTPDELRALVEGYLDELALTPELGTLAELDALRAAGGGKRDPARCSASRRATRSAPTSRRCCRRRPRSSSCTRSRSSTTTCRRSTTTPSGAAGRRPGPSYGEATAILAGDALLAEAFRLALAYPTPAVARELVEATLGMIGGQQLDLEGGARPRASCTG